MLFPFSYFIFFLTLILGTILSISSSSWFGAWIGLELNLMSFIPLISIKMNYYFSEAALKYFLIQALASTIIISSSCLILFSHLTPYFLILMSLLLKLGAAPFHFWFPQVMEGLSWLQAIILMTIQKFAPMYLISYMVSDSMFLHFTLMSATMSAIVGALSGLNTLKLRKLMAFSSINHMSWMLVAMSLNQTMWLMYFIFYSVISISVIAMFFVLQIYNMSDLLNFKISKSLFMLSIPMSLLSLGGLPPFSGFIPKWMMIQIMLNNNMVLILLFLLMSSLTTLYFYLRMLTPFVLLSIPVLSFNMKASPPQLLFFLSLFSFMNIMGLWLPIPFFIY
uniref:NADH dehydrogenase subunit 2 n=1 Tax=Tetralia glaberrima TaxID=652078 RepID=UPI0028D85915|nr:NADH dehydrogenase subunit 2 [Tetralia glaberrima]YP_010952852.1 NADH dehydrogenase subunit 2 [Tetralia nigrolineata]WMQ53103.1 NADH dehydrogenase subunit 2 [Tetralia glaberrima]WMQ53272.1 NADH dehydrogenase subunit 2 [Tetralia nigrolineata]